MLRIGDEFKNYSHICGHVLMEERVKGKRIGYKRLKRTPATESAFVYWGPKKNRFPRGVNGPFYDPTKRIVVMFAGVLNSRFARGVRRSKKERQCSSA